LIDLNSLKVKTTFRGHESDINSALFKKFSNLIVSSSSDQTVSLWDGRNKNGICSHTFKGHTNSVNYAVFDYQGNSFASSDCDGNVILWDLKMMKMKGMINIGNFSANKISFDVSGKNIIIPSNNKKIYFYSTEKKNEKDQFIKNFEINNENNCEQVILNVESNLLFGTSDSVVKIYNL
jgi:WD40 repeat protein